MLQTIQIHNFQSHENSQLDLSPGINTLVGDSDCGKSAVMRSILWGITNNPQGDAYVSDWTKTPKGTQMAGAETSVTIETNPRGEGRFSVSRRRSPKFNGYSVFDGSENVDYEALRTDVPKEISQCFNIGAVNIQRQMDPPFLISATPGEAARFINELVNLTDIDEAQTEINSLSRACSADLKAAQASLDKAEGQVENMAWVDRLQELSRNITALEYKMDTACIKATRIDKALGEYREAEKTCQELARIDAAADHIEAARKVGAAIGTASSKFNRLASSIKAYRELPVIADDLLNRATDALAMAVRDNEKNNQLSASPRSPARIAKAVDEYRAAAGTIDGLSRNTCRAEAVLEKAAVTEKRLTGMPQTLTWIKSTLEKVLDAGPLAGLDLEALQVPLNRATRAARKLEAAQSRAKFFSTTIQDFADATDTSIAADEESEKILQELNGAICPVCGRPLNLHGEEHMKK